MGFDSFAVSILLMFSSLLGVEAISTDRAGWTVSRAWESQGDHLVFEATSADLVRQCKEKPHGFIAFPSVIHGAHSIYLDQQLISTFGDSSFRSVRSFYGAPYVECSTVKEGSLLSWRVNSYSQYFARIKSFPVLMEHRPLYNVFAETAHVIAAGGTLLTALFAFTMFIGKVGLGLTLSVTIATFAVSVYFVGATSGFFNLSWSMLTAHRVADIGAWTGLFLLFNALRIEGLLSKRIFIFYTVNVVLGLAIIAVGSSGDVIQLGTSLPFGASTVVLLLPLFRLSTRFSGTFGNRRRLLQYISLAFFLGSCFYEMLVITGLFHTAPALPIGFLGGVLFLTLSVNDRITETYRERDYLRENLEVEVERKTRELNKKTEDLQLAMSELKTAQAELVQSAKLASLGTLSAGIAHEINNSLNFVNGALRPLEKLIGKTNDENTRPKMEKLVKVMREGLSLTLEIVKSLRNYTGLNQAKFNDVNIREVVGSVLTILKSKGRDLKIELEIPEELTVYGSVVGLNQVFMNLIGNAMDAMEDGGRLAVCAHSKDDLAKIQISDTGAGIPANIVERIFDPFFTTKDVGSGTGLGLHIVKGEIERHQGTIEVSSTEGGGTIFSIVLPVSGSRNQIESQSSRGSVA